MKLIVFAALLLGILMLPLLRELLRRRLSEARRKGAPGSYANLKSGRTYYDWHGHVDGPVAVLVHGLSTSSYVWGGVTEILTRMGFRILTYDLYGRGLSDRVPGAQDADFHLRQLTELLEDQKIEDSFTLVGYSMGGAVATAFANRHPEKLDRLVLFAPAGLESNMGWFTRFIVKTPVLGDWLFHMFYPRALRGGIVAEQREFDSAVPDIWTKQIAEMRYHGYFAAMLSSLRHLVAKDQSAEHRAIAEQDLPVLAVWGERDDVISLSCLGKLAQINRNARQVSIPGAPHGLIYTHPKQVREALQELMRDGL